MEETKKIPCRVCGKLFKPCAYCKSHADTFRWRNFACSKECATKYINDTIAYRESLKSKVEDAIHKNEDVKNVKETEKTEIKKKPIKKSVEDFVENEIEKNETE